MIQQIITAFAPRMGDCLLEIGPGQGALTFPLLKQMKQLSVIELDRDLIPMLQARGTSLGELTIYQADALEFDYARLRQDETLLRIIGNLPYNISTPLIFHLLDYTTIIADMLFMLQKEVAERLAAVSGGNHYGRLSVMVQYRCQVQRLFDVSPQAFYPPPKVQSSIVHLVPYRELPYRAKNEILFSSLVKEAFGQRRKTLRNSLKHRIQGAMWAHLPVDPAMRAENVSVQDFVKLSNALSAIG